MICRLFSMGLQKENYGRETKERIAMGTKKEKGMHYLDILTINIFNMHNMVSKMIIIVMIHSSSHFCHL